MKKNEPPGAAADHKIRRGLSGPSGEWEKLRTMSLDGKEDENKRIRATISLMDF